MSYTVLARKWRPVDLAGIVGQEKIVASLNFILESQSLHTVYLLHGTRGVGKTTLARILAKGLNCEQGITSTPCHRCASCIGISSGRFPDVLEIDGASRTKVEDIRDLLENLTYAPVQGRYKVYIIDEVHMLSTHSFNALLKSLEEPPPHVVFILATTEVNKLPSTILSRCLQLPLLRIPEADIAAYLEQVLTTENIHFEKPAAALLAKAAEGSLRDSLSLLEQALAAQKGALTYQQVTQTLGLIGPAELLDLLHAIITEQPEAAYQQAQHLVQKTHAITHLLKNLAEVIHHLALAEMVPEALPETLTDRKTYIELATKARPDVLQLYYQIILQAQKNLPFAPNEEQGFLMTILRLLSFEPVQYGLSPNPEGTSWARLKQTTQDSPAKPAVTTAKPAVTTAPPIPSDQPVSETLLTAESWSTLRQRMALSGMLKVLIENLHFVSDNGTVLCCELEAHYQAIMHERYRLKLEEHLGTQLSSPRRLEINLQSSASSSQAPPTQKARVDELEQLKQADPNVKTLVEGLELKLEKIERT